MEQPGESPWKSRLAVAVYLAGTLSLLAITIPAFASASFLGVVGALMYGFAVWWIAAGIGIRLGTKPEEFFRGLARTIGFVTDDVERESSAK